MGMRGGGRKRSIAAVYANILIRFGSDAVALVCLAGEAGGFLDNSRIALRPVRPIFGVEPHAAVADVNL